MIPCIPYSSDILIDPIKIYDKTQNIIVTDYRKLKDVVEPADGDVELEESESDGDEMITVEVETPKEKWDCESILSTYSTLYNHPKTIQEPKKVSHKCYLSLNQSCTINNRYF